MRVVVTTEQRFCRTPDGAVWTPGPGARPFWDGYLGVFDAVRVVARVEARAAAPAGWARADGPRVGFAPLPNFLGPEQFLRRWPALRRAARAAVAADDAVILRVPSIIAELVEGGLRRAGHPYGVEVVADPQCVFSAGGVDHPLRRFFGWWFAHSLRRQSPQAPAAAYVTEGYLQERYPPSPAPGAFTTHYSDVLLPAGAIVAAPPALPRRPNQLTLISVASLAQLYKAPDVVIDAVAACHRAGLDLRLVWVGDGKYRPAMAARARAHGVGDRVRFTGSLAAPELIRAELDQADLFVLASRSEGLPRALVEAMARGLPCLGSTVGGIPELLAPEDLVPPGDADALAAKIVEVARAPGRLARMAARNLATAQAYRPEVLHLRRLAFFERLREQTAWWCAGRTPRPLLPGIGAGLAQ